MRRQKLPLPIDGARIARRGNTLEALTGTIVPCPVMFELLLKYGVLLVGSVCEATDLHQLHLGGSLAYIK